MKLLNPLLATRPRFTLLLLRLVLGFLFFVHGSQLVFGWFGGFGLGGAFCGFPGEVAITAFLAYLAGFFSFFCGVPPLFGFWVRVPPSRGPAADGVSLFCVHLPRA